MKILLIEDDSETARCIADGLYDEGHEIDIAVDGRDGLLRVTGERWDVVIADRMLPSLDGLALVRTVRAAGCQTPIIMLTALASIDDRVAGLNAGADDYMSKPFALVELAARVNALGRRPRDLNAPTVLRVADLELNLLTRSARRGPDPIQLPPQEFRLLEYLMRHSGRIVTRTMILESVWDFHFDPSTNVVETHICRLRAKLHRNGGPELIHTVRGAGYALHATA